jgi:hypothetical protein
MTHAELYEVAKRRGKVRWTKSGLVETVRLPKKPRLNRMVIMAIQKRRGAKALFCGDRSYDCVEVPGSGVKPPAARAPAAPSMPEIFHRVAR